METDTDGDGIMESPFDGNHFDENRSRLNCKLLAGLDGTGMIGG